MLTWLRKFFYSDDEIVKLAAGLSEPEAEMWRGLLASNGVAAMFKNMSFLSVDWGRTVMPGANNFDLYVKESDVDNAIEILGSMLDENRLARKAAESRRDVRRFRGRMKP